MQIQITKIENGYLLGTPGRQPNPQMRDAGEEPTLTYCEDYAAICNALATDIFL